MRGSDFTLLTFDVCEKEIESYCNDHQLRFDRVKKLSRSYDKNSLILQYHDPEKGKKGLLDETPMPIVLLVKKREGYLDFEQTKYTRKYLSQ